MSNRFRLIATLGAVLLLKVGTIAQSVPTLINYQGQIQNPNGTPPPTADYELTVNIYDQPTGGTLIWGPQRFNGQSGLGLAAKVPVVQGYFNLTLGPQDMAARSVAAAFGGSARYIELRVGTNQPIQPRQQFLSAPFALRAGTAGNSDNASKLAGHDWGAFFSNGDPLTGKISGTRLQASTISDAQLSPGIAVPVGAVIMWWGSLVQLPAGFELCDGGFPTNSGALLQINKPDLRDRFVKGASLGTSDVKDVPVAGGTHTLDLRHSHEMDHTHAADGLWVPISGGPRNAIWFGEIGGNIGHPRGNVGPGYGLVVGPTRGTSQEEQQAIKAGTAVSGNTGTASRTYTSQENPGFGITDNRPAFLEVFFIIRVK